MGNKFKRNDLLIKKDLSLNVCNLITIVDSNKYFYWYYDQTTRKIFHDNIKNIDEQWTEFQNYSKLMEIIIDLRDEQPSIVDLDNLKNCSYLKLFQYLVSLGLDYYEDIVKDEKGEYRSVEEIVSDLHEAFVDESLTYTGIVPYVSFGEAFDAMLSGSECGFEGLRVKMYNGVVMECRHERLNPLHIEKEMIEKKRWIIL